MTTSTAPATSSSRVPHRSPASRSGRGLAGSVGAKASGVVGEGLVEALLLGGVAIDMRSVVTFSTARRLDDSDDDGADLDEDGLADRDQRARMSVLTEGSHLHGGDAHEEGLLGLRGDDVEVVELVLVDLDLVQLREHGVVELALAFFDRGLRRGAREPGHGRELSDLRVAARPFVVDPDHDGVAGGLHLEDQAGVLVIAMLPARRGDRTGGDGDRVAVDRDDQSW